MVVGKGCDGVIAVHGGEVDGHSQALKDAAQDKRHVSNAILGPALHFFPSPGVPFIHRLLGRN